MTWALLLKMLPVLLLAGLALAVLAWQWAAGELWKDE